MKEFTAELNRFYKTHSAMYAIERSFDGYEWLVVDDKSQNVSIYSRKDGKGNEVVVVLNFSNMEYKNYRFGVDEGVYTEALVSTATDWKKSRKRRTAKPIPSHKKNFSLTLDIPPMSGMYLTHKNKQRGIKQ
jgi:1,4-alpha-glucan branching enzyme